MRFILPTKKIFSVLLIGLMLFSLVVPAYTQMCGCVFGVKKNNAAPLNNLRGVTSCCSKKEIAEPLCQKFSGAPFTDPCDPNQACCCVTKSIQLPFKNLVVLNASFKMLKFEAAIHAKTNQTILATSYQPDGKCSQNSPIISPHISTTILLL